MTTGIGIYQHGKLDKPAPEFGYAIEDQARALIVADSFGDERLKNIYLNFILRARRGDGLLYHFFYENNHSKGSFRNYENIPGPQDINLEEAYGLTLWALLTVKIPGNINFKKIIENLIIDAHEWTSPRAISAALLGLSNLNNPNSLEDELKIKLHNLYLNTHSGDWMWFENYLAYANAIIPWALWEVYLKRKCRTSFEIASKVTRFLIKECQENGVPAPVGNKGWYFRGGKKALYDQQPIDAAYMVCCLEKAYYVTKDDLYKNQAENWYRWFFGNNLNGIPLIDKNFACYDGLTPDGVNLNQGAESNICFQMAFLAAKRLGIRNY
jgi:hypothetical protein